MATIEQAIRHGIKNREAIAAKKAAESAIAPAAAHVAPVTEKPVEAENVFAYDPDSIYNLPEPFEQQPEPDAD